MSDQFDTIVPIANIQKLGDVGQYWADYVRPNRHEWAHPLSELEEGYIRAFTDPSTPKALQMRDP